MNAGFWWVNHPTTCRTEIEGSYLWFADKPRKGKARSESDKNTQKLLPGDIVFSCGEGSIGAVGVVLKPARESARPAELDAVPGLAELRAGWLVPVRFMALVNPLRICEHSSELAPVLPRKHSPVLASGAPNQHVALAAVPPNMVVVLSRLMAGEVERIVGAITEAHGRPLADDAEEAAIQDRTDIAAALKLDLLKARHGQGVFRTNLESNEHSCRITGVLDRRHLWARHIKPWSECEDGEKLDGANGLLMSPHIAHLFERGYISFGDDGELLVSQELNPVVLANWHIELPLNVGEFSSEQCVYLDYHRREVFQHHGTGRRQKSTENYDPIPSELAVEPATVRPA